MRLVVRELEPVGGGKARSLESSEAQVDFNVDTAELVAHDGPGGAARSQALVDVLRRNLGEDHREFLRQRWQRVKAQGRDEWLKQDWARIDIQYLVSYFEVFPSDWDLGVACFGQRYWLVDSWCLKPNCACEELCVEVLSADGTRVGVVRVETRKWKALDAERDSLASQIWNEFIRTPRQRRALRQRRDAIREVARELPRVMAVEAPAPPPRTMPAESAGRNDPCPCGSGKKYKKCCAV
jgi:hypothetical protein